MCVKGKLSKPFTEVVVVPMTFRSCRPGSSSRIAFVGERGVPFLKKGECDGVRRRAGWLILSLYAFVVAVVVFCNARVIAVGASSVARASLHGCFQWNVTVLAG